MPITSCYKIYGLSSSENPDKIIWNYYNTTMPWILINAPGMFHAQNYMIVHEPVFYPPPGFIGINVDPTFKETENHFASPRPLLEYRGEYPKNEIN